MPIASLTFTDPINSSVQPGDIVYYVNTSTLPNSTVQQALTSNVTKFGVVVSTTANSINVRHTSAVSLPLAGFYIMFEKDKQVNSSSLIGYYAEVELMNNSDAKIELFSLGSEVSENSK